MRKGLREGVGDEEAVESDLRYIYCDETRAITLSYSQFENCGHRSKNGFLDPSMQYQTNSFIDNILNTRSLRIKIYRSFFPFLVQNTVERREGCHGARKGVGGREVQRTSKCLRIKKSWLPRNNYDLAINVFFID